MLVGAIQEFYTLKKRNSAKCMLILKGHDSWMVSATQVKTQLDLYFMVNNAYAKDERYVFRQT
jgi:hypothetical protein